MTMDLDNFTSGLEAVLRRKRKDFIGIRDLQRLSGGASQEIWALDALTVSGILPLILRRSPGGAKDIRKNALDVETEAGVLQAVHLGGAPVPQVYFILSPDDGLGHGFVMERIAGDSLPGTILREPSLENMRKLLTGQLARALAQIHQLDITTISGLRQSTAREELLYYQDIYTAHAHPLPVFELAFRWLLDHLPPVIPLKLVHGDFRNGNFIVGPEGLRAVLDWELAHIGDPMEDLGWLCVNSWRFGRIEHPVGGFGSYEELFAVYQEVSGIPVDPAHVRFWEVFGTLKWGIFCLQMVDTFRHGHDKTIERAAVGRRISETEIDLLRLLAPRT